MVEVRTPVISQSTYLNLNERSNISSVSHCKIIGCAEQENSTKDQDTVVHGDRGGWCYWRPEAEEDNNDYECAGYSIDSNAPHPGDFEGTPLQTTLPGYIGT